MPRHKPDPEAVAASNARIEWDRAFTAELVRLRPHLAGTSKLTATIIAAARADGDGTAEPKAAAQRQLRAASRGLSAAPASRCPTP